MLPGAYATPAAVVLVVGGLLTCFAGYRLFRLVLLLYGFYAGALVTTSFMDPGGTWGLVVAAIVGGIVGAVLMVAAYFMGVGLVGAGIAALVVHGVARVFGAEPPTVLLVIACVLGALGALSIARWVVIFGTAIAGAWTMLVGGLAIAGNTTAMAAAPVKDPWIVYPLDPLPKAWWVTAAWIGLTLVGVIVQMTTTSKWGKRKRKKKDGA